MISSHFKFSAFDESDQSTHRSNLFSRNTPNPPQNPPTTLNQQHHDNSKLMQDVRFKLKPPDNSFPHKNVINHNQQQLLLCHSSLLIVSGCANHPMCVANLKPLSSEENTTTATSRNCVKSRIGQSQLGMHKKVGGLRLVSIVATVFIVCMLINHPSSLIKQIYCFCPSKCQCDNQRLTTNCSLVQNVNAIPLTLNPLLKQLSLTSLQLKGLTTSLTVYQQLEYLDLHNNHLQIVEAKNFNNLKKLQHLNLNDNRIEQLGSQQLTPSSSVVNNRLSSESSSDIWPGGGDKLQQHSEEQKGKVLTDDQYEYEPAFLELVQLQELHLRGNKLQRIQTHAFLGLVSLKILDLSDNMIYHMNSNSLVGLICLQQLRLRQNRLKRVPTEAFKLGPLITLKLLDLGQNPLGADYGSQETLPAGSIVSLVELEELYLDSCQLSYLDDNAIDIDSSKHLKIVNLSSNEMRQIPQGSLGKMIELRQLILNENLIEYIEAGSFKGLKSLERLSINYQALLTSIDLRAFDNDGTTNLTHLSIESNIQLKTIFMSPSSQLDDDNEMKWHQSAPTGSNINHHQHSSSVPNFESLKFLSLRNNQLSHLSERILPWSKLHFLDLSNNPFNCTCNLWWLHLMLRNNVKLNNNHQEMQDVLSSFKSFHEERYHQFIPQSIVQQHSATSAQDEQAIKLHQINNNIVFNGDNLVCKEPLELQNKPIALLDRYDYRHSMLCNSKLSDGDNSLEAQASEHHSYKINAAATQVHHSTNNNHHHHDSSIMSPSFVDHNQQRHSSINPVVQQTSVHTSGNVLDYNNPPPQSSSTLDSSNGRVPDENPSLDSSFYLEKDKLGGYNLGRQPSLSETQHSIQSHSAKANSTTSTRIIDTNSDNTDSDYKYPGKTPTTKTSHNSNHNRISINSNNSTADDKYQSASMPATSSNNKRPAVVITDNNGGDYLDSGLNPLLAATGPSQSTSSTSSHLSPTYQTLPLSTMRASSIETKTKLESPYLAREHSNAYNPHISRSGDRSNQQQQQPIGWQSIVSQSEELPNNNQPARSQSQIDYELHHKHDNNLWNSLGWRQNPSEQSSQSNEATHSVTSLPAWLLTNQRALQNRDQQLGTSGGDLQQQDYTTRWRKNYTSLIDTSTGNNMDPSGQLGQLSNNLIVSISILMFIIVLIMLISMILMAINKKQVVVGTGNLVSRIKTHSNPGQSSSLCSMEAPSAPENGIGTATFWQRINNAHLQQQQLSIQHQRQRQHQQQRNDDIMRNSIVTTTTMKTSNKNISSSAEEGEQTSSFSLSSSSLRNHNNNSNSNSTNNNNSNDNHHYHQANRHNNNKNNNTVAGSRNLKRAVMVHATTTTSKSSRIDKRESARRRFASSSLVGRVTSSSTSSTSSSSSQQLNSLSKRHLHHNSKSNNRKRIEKKSFQLPIKGNQRHYSIDDDDDDTGAAASRNSHITRLVTNLISFDWLKFRRDYERRSSGPPPPATTNLMISTTTSRRHLTAEQIKYGIVRNGATCDDADDDDDDDDDYSDDHYANYDVICNDSEYCDNPGGGGGGAAAANTIGDFNNAVSACSTNVVLDKTSSPAAINGTNYHYNDDKPELGANGAPSIGKVTNGTTAAAADQWSVTENFFQGVNHLSPDRSIHQTTTHLPFGAPLPLIRSTTNTANSGSGNLSTAALVMKAGAQNVNDLNERPTATLIDLANTIYSASDDDGQQSLVSKSVASTNDFNGMLMTATKKPSDKQQQQKTDALNRNSWFAAPTPPTQIAIDRAIDATVTNNPQQQQQQQHQQQLDLKLADDLMRNYLAQSLLVVDTAKRKQQKSAYQHKGQQIVELPSANQLQQAIRAANEKIIGYNQFVGVVTHQDHHKAADHDQLDHTYQYIDTIEANQGRSSQISGAKIGSFKNRQKRDEVKSVAIYGNLLLTEDDELKSSPATNGGGGGTTGTDGVNGDNNSFYYYRYNKIQ